MLARGAPDNLDFHRKIFYRGIDRPRQASMGSLDSHFFQNSYQEFPHSSSYNPYGNDFFPVPASPPVDRPVAYKAHTHNPFASTGYDEAVPPPPPPPPRPHPPARYNPLSQSLPAFPSNVCYGNSTLNRPSTPVARVSSNPFAHEYDLLEPEVGIPLLAHHEQQQVDVGVLLGPYSYLSNRASTPTNVRQQYGHPVYNFPVQHQELIPVPPPNDAVVPYNPSGTPNSQRLLWLTEEEAEIIRLIRLSRSKENLRLSGFSLCEEQQITPVPSPRPVADCRASAGKTVEKATLCTENKTSNLHPVEDFSLPASAVVSRSVEKQKPQEKVPQVQEKPLLDCSLERVDTAKTVDDDRQWIAIQRQKMKDIATRKRQNAAICLQKHWREHRIRVLNGSSNSIRQKPSPKPPNTVRTRVPRSRPQEGAKVIQRAWRKYSERRRLLKSKAQPNFPMTLKGYYDLIKQRHVTKNLSPPSYGRFIKVLERIHACTEGARVRKRLKTRRLQAVVKEIKEIRFLLEDMLQETAPGSSELVAQLTGQLQQKIKQLHTALQGPGDAARYLLRRGPATPLVIYGSRSTSPTSHLQKSGDQAQIRVIGNSQTETGVPSLRCSLFTVNKSNDKVPEGFQGRREIRPPSDFAAKPPRKVEVLRKETPGPPEERPKVQAPEKSAMSKNAQYIFIDKNLDAQLPLPKTETGNVVASRLSQYLVSRSREPDEYGYESSIRTAESDMEQSDQERPKRPFLRRKSMAMAPHKLDWSKVKPMVSSRLEPELKTKLYKTKVKETAASKKMNYSNVNYSNVKSRVFNCEGVDTSGGLTDRSVDPDFVEGVPSARPFSPKPPPKLPSYRYGKSVRDSYCEPRSQAEVSALGELEHNGELERKKQNHLVRDSYCEPRSQTEASAVEEINHNGELERKKQTHSFRYKDAGTAAPQASPEKEQVKNPPETIMAKRDCIVEETLGDDSARKSQNETFFASPELETMVRHVMALKDDTKMNVYHLFGVQEENSIIPGLSPNSPVFTCSFAEKRKLHEVLIHEGRASKLQPDALAFVSLRD